MKIDKGDKVGAGPKNLARPGNPLWDLKRSPFSTFHGGVSQVWDYHIDRCRIQVAPALNKVHQFLMRILIMSTGHNNQGLPGYILRKGMINFTITKLLADHVSEWQTQFSRNLLSKIR